MAKTSTKQDRVSTVKRQNCYPSIITKHTKTLDDDSSLYDKETYSLEHHFDSEIKFLSDFVLNRIGNDSEALFLLNVLLTNEKLCETDLLRVSKYGNRMFALGYYFKNKGMVNLGIATEALQYLLQARWHVEDGDAHGAALKLIKAGAKTRLIALAIYDKEIQRGREKTNGLKRGTGMLSDELRQKVCELIRLKINEGKSAIWAYRHINKNFEQYFPNVLEIKSDGTFPDPPAASTMKTWYQNYKK